VVDLQVLSGATDLAFPAVAAQYLSSKLFVGFGIKPQARLFGSNPGHEVFSVTSCRKACLCSPGRNLKNRGRTCRSSFNCDWTGKVHAVPKPICQDSVPSRRCWESRAASILSRRHLPTERIDEIEKESDFVDGGILGAVWGLQYSEALAIGMHVKV
jgi:hypothetical protein